MFSESKWFNPGGGAAFDTTLIGNSVWFDGSADYMDKTFSSGSAQSRIVYACWLQRNDFTRLQSIFTADKSGRADRFGFQADDTIDIHLEQNGGSTIIYSTSNVFRDTGWYHFILSIDLNVSQASAVQLYVNGVQNNVTVTFGPSAGALSTMDSFGNAATHAIGKRSAGSDRFSNTYQTQCTLLVGQSIQNGDVAVTDFLDAFTYGTNGSQYAPKSDANIAALASTAGGNSFCLDFADSADLGNDISSNANDFTPTSMSSTNQTTNTPSLVYPKISNIGTPSGDAAANYTMGLGSNRMVYSGGDQVSKGLISTTIIQPDDPKIYWEYYVETGSVSGNGGRLGNGIAIPQFNVGNGNGFYGAGGESAFRYRGAMYDNGATSVSGFTIAQAGDIQQMAFEPSTGKVWIGVEGTWRNGAGTSGTTLDESNPDDQLTVQDYVFTMGASRSTDIGVMNFGDNPTMSGNITAGGNADENGYGNFKYAVPSGFLAPNSANLTAPDYQGIDYFNATLYTGNGTAIGSGGKAVTGVGFQPDFTWIKNRDAADSHILTDVVRGVTKYISSDSTAAEATNTEALSTFDTDGFKVGNLDAVNTNTEDYVSWNWLAGGTGSSNTDGSITATVTVADAGHLSIGTYTGTGANATIGHGLTAAPEFVNVKQLNSTASWSALIPAIGNSNAIFLNINNAATSVGTAYWQNTDPTSSVFSIGTDNGVNASSSTYLFQCFRSVPGLCKVGTYIGNGSATAPPYVSVGFKPSWVMIKKTSGTSNWHLYDTARSLNNEVDDQLLADFPSAETTGSEELDILADGFKIRTADGGINTSAGTYIYLAMADIASGAGLCPIYGR